jgi:hypothetical protein
MSDAKRNDNLRQYLPGALPQPHRCELSAGVCELPEKHIDQILGAIADFSDFDPPDDGHGKNDFGRFQLKGYAVVWLFVVEAMEGLPTAAEAARTLHVMLADEFDLLS